MEELRLNAIPSPLPSSQEEEADFAPILLGEIPLEGEDPEQSSTEFLENFCRNQTQTSSQELGSNAGALVIIRTNRVRDRSPYILPALISPATLRQVRSEAIPLPEIVSQAARSRNSSLLDIDPQELDESNMSLFGVLNCACPLPGTKPMKACFDCRRRECFEWTWEKEEGADSTVIFQNEDRDVLFNPGFSVGTVGIRGSTPLKQGYHHYWEIEMASSIYGTDMMIGVGTEKADLKKHSHSFVSLIGLDAHSWGLSYTGSKHHNGQVHHYTKNFGQHTIVGVHLDLWSGTLEYYINRKPIGKAFTGLQGKTLYPMISSTAARSGMNLVFCRSYPASLQLQTMLSLGQSLLLPDHTSLFKALPGNVIPPGLKLWIKNNFWWITSNKNLDKKKLIEENNKAPEDVKSSAGSEPASSSQSSRRGRKSKQQEAEKAEGVTTRGMAARRAFLPGTSPIFAPDPSCSDGLPRPAKSPRVCRSLERKTVNSKATAGNHEKGNSSETEEPAEGSGRMCLRSSVNKQ